MTLHKTVFAVLFLITPAISDESNISSGFFLNNIKSENFFNITVQSSLNKFTSDFDIYNLNFSSPYLSYNGFINKYYTENFPLKEHHSLFLRIPGGKLTLGFSSSLQLSVQKDYISKETCKFRPDHDNKYNKCYLKTFSNNVNHTRSDYCETMNLKIGDHRRSLILMLGGSLIQNIGYDIVKETLNNEEIHIEIQDFFHKDISYSLCTGILLSSELFFPRNAYLSFAGVSICREHLRNPLRVPPIFIGENSTTSNTSISYSGYRYSRMTNNFWFSIENFQSNPSKAIVHWKKKFSPGFSLNSFRINALLLSESKTSYYFIYNTKNSSFNTDTIHFKNRSLDLSGILVPEFLILKPISFKIPLCLYLQGNGKVIHQETISGVLKFQFPIKNSLLVQSELSSGEFIVDLNKNTDILTFFYRAYTAYIKIQLTKVF